MQMNLIGKIGMVIGLLGGILGLAVAIYFAPVMGSIIAAIFIIVFGWLYISFFRGLGGSKKILETGLPAQATILEVRDTGVTVNNNPQIKLILQVTPSTGIPYQAEVKLLISRLETYKYQPGMTLPVKYDPNDTSRVAIDFSGNGSSGQASAPAVNPAQTQQLQDMLVKIDNANQQLMQYGEEAKAIVMKYIPMGINVNGNNPAVTVELEVLPSSREPFKATAKGVIKDTSVPKYQPGCEIYVKFDPNDTSKVTMSHS
jgi:hypothetical protein